MEEMTQKNKRLQYKEDINKNHSTGLDGPLAAPWREGGGEAPIFNLCKKDL